MASRIELQARLAFKKSALEKAQTAYLALLDGGVASYTIGSRNLTRFDLPKLEESIAKLEGEIEELEAQLNGGGRRKAFGVVPRDF